MKHYDKALTQGVILQGGSCQYRIEKVLGQGSFGITYLASVKMAGALGTIDANVKVAIKEFFMGDINGRQGSSVEGLTEGSLPYKYAQRFRKEAENLAKLNHPNIVKVIDFVEANNTYYYVMEYIDGEDLLHYMNDKPLPMPEAISIIKDVGKALSYMHKEKNMLHLDLKPGNIMRRRSDGHIFLIDFGLTKIYADDGKPETSTTIGQGTQGYAPLEQTNPSSKKNSFGPTIDVYALGATLLKLLTAESIPSASDVLNDDELLEGILSKHGIGGKIKSAILKAMEPRPKERTSSVRELIMEIEETCTKNGSDVDATVYDSDATSQTSSSSATNNRDKLDTLQSNEKEDKNQEVPYDKNSVGHFYDGLAKVRGLNGKYGFINQEGKLLIPCQWIAAESFSSGMAAVKDVNHKWGYIDTTGEVVIPCKWEGTQLFLGEVAKVKTVSDEWIQIDKNGHALNEKSYISVISTPPARVSIDGVLKGETPNRFEVEPGKHEVVVENGKDWIPFRSTCIVEKGKTFSFGPNLQPIRKVDDEANEKYSAPKEPSTEELYNRGKQLYDSADYIRAFPYLKNAAGKGHSDSQFHVGYMYKSGTGVAQDYEEAVKWYRKSAAQGHSQAQYNLGVMYERGTGVAQDYEEAIKWYRKSAAQGHSWAQYNLGVMYENGHGVEKDLFQAKKWYKLAAERGDKDAQEKLKKIETGTKLLITQWLLLFIVPVLILCLIRFSCGSSASPQDYYDNDSLDEVVDSVAYDSVSISEEIEPELPSDAEIYEQAYKNKDWATIEQLGNKGYVHAYYPLALHYYKLRNFSSCEKWARKAIQAGVDIPKASGLFTEIEAEEAYKKAELYVSNEYKAYDKALFYAQKASALSKNHSKRLSEIISICEKFNPPPYSE